MTRDNPTARGNEARCCRRRVIRVSLMPVSVWVVVGWYVTTGNKCRFLRIPRASTSDSQASASHRHPLFAGIRSVAGNKTRAI